MRLNRIVILLIVFAIANTKADEKKNFLWEINKDGKVVYLLGSVHAGKSDLYPLAEIIEQKYEECDAIAVEADIEKVNQMSVAMKMMLTKGTLKDNVSDSTYKLLKAKFDELKMQESVYSMFKPWAAAMMITQMEAMKSGYLSDNGIDRHFIKKARGNKEILELESIDMQLALFDNFSDMNDELVYYTLEKSNESNKQLEQIFQFWAEGDVDAMEKFVDESFVDEDARFEPLKKSLLDDRNIAMADKIDKYFTNGKKVFVIVGAAHITGEIGLLNLLEKKGCTVRQL